MSAADRLQAELHVGGSRLMVVRYDLERSLSAVDRLSCHGVAPDADLPEPAEVVGAVAVFKARRDGDGAELHFRGEVVEAWLARSGDGMRTLGLDVRPRLWRLGARRASRVFREQSVQQIVQQVLVSAGIPAAQQDWRLGAASGPRTYVAQHNETELHFVMRLLSEEGIYFGCSYEAEDEARVLFGDDPSGFGAVTRGPGRLPFVTSFGGDAERDVVTQLSRVARVRPARVTARDYDPDRPSLELEAESEGLAADAALEVYAFPARTADPDQTHTRAVLQREGLEHDRAVVVGETGALSLDPGFSFDIDGHPYAPLNGSFIVRSLRFRGSIGRQFALGTETDESHHTCRFEAVPVSSALRPTPVAPARRAAGVHLAVTVGPPGEEIFTDERGRVTAQFLWDREGKRDDHSSCWMRTSQVPTGGSMMIPRMGWEVAVRYAEGDVDVPLVLERLYNGMTPPPYSLPENAARSSIQTATTPGGGSSNELRMSDVRGEEQMFLNASRDMSVEVGNNTTASIGNDQAVSVGANQAIAILDSMSSAVGGNQACEVGANQTCSVATLMVEDVGGSHSLTIGANRNHTVGGDHKRVVSGNSSLEVGGNEMNLVLGDVSDSTSADFTHDIGAAYIQMCGGDRSLLVGGARSETTSAAKVLLVKGNRGVEAGLLSAQTGGAQISQVAGDSDESATIAYTETVGGITQVTAKNVVFEATTLLSLTMGGASITLTPAGVSISGASVKMDGNVVETGVVIDN